MKNIYFRTIILFAFVFAGCVNIQYVHDFAVISGKSLGKYEDMPYNFTMHCQDQCLFNAMKTYSINRNNDCNCQLYEQADSVSLIIVTRLMAYFMTLEKIAANETSTASFTPIHKSFAESTFGRTDEQGKFHGIAIDKNECSAIDTLSSIITNIFLGAYKKNKIRQYIQQANPAVQILLAKLKYIEQNNLSMELSYKKETLYEHYREMIVAGGVSGYEKEIITLDYYRQLNDVLRKQKGILLYGCSLDSIASGHQKLFDNRDHLSAASIKTIVGPYAGAMKNLIAAINKLQN